MAYQTGASVSFSALMDAVKAFAVANGWTLAVDDSYTLAFAGSGVTHSSNQSMALMYAGDQNFSGAAASAVARRLVLSNGAAWFTLLAYAQTGYKNQQAGNYNYIEIWSAESYVAGAANAAAGTNNRKLALCGTLSAGPFTAYHLFGAASHLHLVIEESVGQFRHLSIGSIEKYGSWTGGAYAQASWWTEFYSGASAFNAGNNCRPFGADKAVAFPTSVGFYPGIRADIEAANVWVDLVGSPSTDMGVGRYGLTPWPPYARLADPQASDGNGLLAQWYDFTPLSWSGAAPLAPLEVSVGLSNGYWTLLGAFPGVRYCNMANLAPGDEITLGSDVWKVFPVFGKNYTSGAWATSFDHALAYKK